MTILVSYYINRKIGQTSNYSSLRIYSIAKDFDDPDINLNSVKTLNSSIWNYEFEDEERAD